MSDPANTVSEKEPGMPAAASEPTPATPAEEVGTPSGEEPKKKREYKDFGHDEEKATRMYSLF